MGAAGSASRRFASLPPAASPSRKPASYKLLNKIQLSGWVRSVIVTKSGMSAGEMLLKNIANDSRFPPSFPLSYRRLRVGSVVRLLCKALKGYSQGGKGAGATHVSPKDPLQSISGRDCKINAFPCRGGNAFISRGALTLAAVARGWCWHAGTAGASVHQKCWPLGFCRFRYRGLHCFTG